MKRPPTWAYGVTTVPARREVLLPQTIRSLAHAGFDSPHLFIDSPDAGSYITYNLPYTIRTKPIKAFGNWTLAIMELYLRHPSANRYALFQDDILAIPNLRDYLDRFDLPPRTYWNLCTYPVNAARAPAVDHLGWFLSDQMGRGAQALVFSQETVVDLLSARTFIEHARSAMLSHRAIDGVSSRALHKAGYTEFVHLPSLVGHYGQASTIPTRPQPDIEAFPGESFDLLSILPQSKQNPPILKGA